MRRQRFWPVTLFFLTIATLFGHESVIAQDVRVSLQGILSEKTTELNSIGISTESFTTNGWWLAASKNKGTPLEVKSLDDSIQGDAINNLATATVTGEHGTNHKLMADGIPKDVISFIRLKEIQGFDLKVKFLSTGPKGEEVVVTAFGSIDWNVISYSIESISLAGISNKIDRWGVNHSGKDAPNGVSWETIKVESYYSFWDEIERVFPDYAAKSDASIESELRRGLGPDNANIDVNTNALVVLDLEHPVNPKDLFLFDPDTTPSLGDLVYQMRRRIQIARAVLPQAELYLYGIVIPNGQGTYDLKWDARYDEGYKIAGEIHGLYDELDGICPNIYVRHTNPRKLVQMTHLAMSQSSRLTTSDGRLLKLAPSLSFQNSNGNAIAEFDNLSAQFNALKYYPRVTSVLFWAPSDSELLGGMTFDIVHSLGNVFNERGNWQGDFANYEPRVDFLFHNENVGRDVDNNRSIDLLDAIRVANAINSGKNEGFLVDVDGNGFLIEADFNWIINNLGN